MSIARKLAQLQDQHLLRERFCISNRADNNVLLRETQNSDLIHFCNNDYLNIAADDAVKTAFQEGAARYGLGSTASAQIAGYHEAHAELEHAFASFLKRDRALLFNSGYHANLAVMTTFANRHHHIFADKYSHASIQDGALLSRATYLRYQHNDLTHLHFLLEKHKATNPIVITESVFSMQGDITSMPALIELTNTYKATLMIDDAHGIGVLGKEGAGICEHFHLSQQEVPCLIVPLGKALGSMGAIVAGSNETIDMLLQSARTYRYSTALPPAICYATKTALAIVASQEWRRQKLWSLIQFFIDTAKARNIPLFSDAITPIKSINIGDNRRTKQIQDILLRKGFFVSCIRPPTVPHNHACIRISLNALHTEEQIIELLDNIATIL